MICNIKIKLYQLDTGSPCGAFIQSPRTHNVFRLFDDQELHLTCYKACLMKYKTSRFIPMMNTGRARIDEIRLLYQNI